MGLAFILAVAALVCAVVGYGLYYTKTEKIANDLASLENRYNQILASVGTVGLEDETIGLERKK